MRVKILRLRGVPIAQQLRLEEGLHRSKIGEDAPKNGTGWVVLNHPGEVQEPTIVLGFSGKIHKLVDEEQRELQQVKMLRRFTGGGTVVVDENTIFASFLMNSENLLPEIEAFPRPIMRWTGEFYSRVFRDRLGVEDFSLKTDDYVINDVKIGGNAQAISGKTWIHHTSFLWDFESDRMKVLKMPDRRPEYRRNRDHDEFLLRMKDVVRSESASPERFLDAVEEEVREIFQDTAEVVNGTVDEAEHVLAQNRDRREVTRWEEK